MRSMFEKQNIEIPNSVHFIGRREYLVVEVKRKREIDESIITEMKKRIAQLPLRKGMTPRPVLVYEGELAPYVEGSGYFDAVISAAKLIGR